MFAPDTDPHPTLKTLSPTSDQACSFFHSSTVPSPRPALTSTIQAHKRSGNGHDYKLHATDYPSQIAPILRCLDIPPPESTVMARTVAARAALRSSQPRLHDGATGGDGSRRSGAVERAFRTGLTALGSQGCMLRTGAAATPAVVLKGGDRAVWPVGAEQSTDVRACHSRSRLPASSL